MYVRMRSPNWEVVTTNPKCHTNKPTVNVSFSFKKNLISYYYSNPNAFTYISLSFLFYWFSISFILNLCFCSLHVFLCAKHFFGLHNHTYMVMLVFVKLVILPWSQYDDIVQSIPFIRCFLIFMSKESNCWFVFWAFFQQFILRHGSHLFASTHPFLLFGCVIIGDHVL